MQIDVSGLIQVVLQLVAYLKTISLTLGSYTLPLWAVVVALGVLETIGFIFNGGKYKKDDE